MSEQTQKERDIRQLRRLEFIMDVIFAIVIWRLFMLLPRPSGDEGTLRSFASYFAEQTEVIAMVAIGLALVTIYWMQNNYVFGHLERTNGRHATLSFLQIFSLLLFLYSIRVGISFEGQFDALMFESLAAALMGLLAVASVSYAHRAGLVSEDVTEEGASKVRRRLLEEPVTALLTVPAALLGHGAWTIAWFLFPLVGWLLRRIPRV